MPSKSDKVILKRLAQEKGIIGIPRFRYQMFQVDQRDPPPPFLHLSYLCIYCNCQISYFRFRNAMRAGDYYRKTCSIKCFNQIVHLIDQVRQEIIDKKKRRRIKCLTPVCVHIKSSSFYVFPAPIYKIIFGYL